MALTATLSGTTAGGSSSTVAPGDRDMPASAWLLLVVEQDREYSGNAVYSDDPRSSYQYDSLVPYHRQLKPKDLVLIRQDDVLLGAANVESIEETQHKRAVYHCPVCDTTDIHRRKTRQPEFRCGRGHEFPSRREEMVDCVKFVAHFERTFVPIDDAFPLSEVRNASLSASDQASIRPIAISGIWEPLVAAVPNIRSLLPTAQYLSADSSTDSGDHSSEGEESFSEDDLRDRVMREIARRRGQRAFRRALHFRFGGQCAVTGCNLADVLEAAHILPYRGPQHNSPDNGLLLRADLHTLFDLDLIGIEPETLTIRVHPSVATSEYMTVDGARLRCLDGRVPSRRALEWRWLRFMARLA